MPAGVSLPDSANIVNYSTIQEAIDSSQTGDCIYVYPGTYNENITINTQNIALVGRNRDSIIIRGTVSVNAQWFTLTGCTVDASSTTDTAVSINGIYNDPHYWTSISGNTIKNCGVGVQCTYTRMSQIVNNKFDSCAIKGVRLSGCMTCKISDNELRVQGIELNDNTYQCSIIDNYLRQINGCGITFDNYTSTTDVKNNLLMDIASHYVYVPDYNTSGLTLEQNVFYNTSSVSFNFADWTTGDIYGNNFSAPSYAFNVPSSVCWWDVVTNKGSFWSNYTGTCTDGDSIGETNLPHQGVDSFPRIYRPVSAFLISSSSNPSCLRSTVLGEQLKIKGIVKTTGAQSGLRFGDSVSLSTDGNLRCTKFLPNSDKWLAISDSLTGNLVWRNATGKAVICIKPNGLVRTICAIAPRN